MMPKLSKQGNQMFVVSVEDTATRTVHDVYCVAEAGKRWVLKSLLTASGLVANDKGVFKWDIPDVVGRCVMGLVDHEPNSYINRAGDKVDAVQHKIIKFRIIEQSDIDKGKNSVGRLRISGIERKTKKSCAYETMVDLGLKKPLSNEKRRQSPVCRIDVRKTGFAPILLKP